MAETSREFQVFAKPAGSLCNLGCRYCYYLKKEDLCEKGKPFRMPDDILEQYIVQHIGASDSPVIGFSWHGGEPTILGLDYFRKIVELQRAHKPAGRRIRNGIQTNGTLLDEEWCRFLAAEGFGVGLSLDGPEELHDIYRVSKNNDPTHRQVMRGYSLLKKHRIPFDILCVVHDRNVRHPMEVYRFFSQIEAPFLGFLPMVELRPDGPGVTGRTVAAEAFGDFLCVIFDEWLSRDIGRVKVQIFEEAIGTAFGQDHALCIFRKTCGDIPVIEHNGDVFACDHFVDKKHRLGNIRETPLVELLECPSQRAFGQAKLDGLPSVCRNCEVLAMCNGGCPKDRFLRTPDGEEGLNYLCAGYKRFFTYCRPFIEQLSALWQRQTEGQKLPAPGEMTRNPARPGRNDPCPCGSGRKYKKCCMGLPDSKF
ncbi:MAG: anaerobic sulfatase maturase [Desulfobacteraceae bacterium]|nr:MAG: anaerobic sulfatase maturase [Desulfobacteraceae bacterium]